MKILISIVFYLIISPSSFSQKISFSEDIFNTKDKTISSIKQFWITYITDITKSNNSNKNLVYSKYWNKTELEDGFADIINEALPVYSIGELEIININKVENGFFQIKNQVQLNGKVIALFNIYVKEESSGYKLYNQFFFSKSTLKHYISGNIDFYYPDDYAFNRKKADELSYSYSKYSDIYSAFSKNKITYIISNTFKDATRLIGIESGIMSSDSPFAGLSIQSQKVVLSSREDHLHEIFHILFSSMFPNSPSIFNEGIATYYGGTGGKDYTTLIGNLKVLIKNHPETDLSNFASIDKTLEDGTNYFYIVGAIFIDYALKTGGTKRVLSLLEHSAIRQNWDDPLPAINDVLGISNDQINSFIKDYIQKNN